MANDCKPRIRPASCPEDLLPAPDECCPNDNVERGWYNAALILRCEAPMIGTPVRVPYATYHSTVSQEAADQLALTYAETQLNCVAPPSVVYYSQEITRTCPDSPDGASISISYLRRIYVTAIRGFSEFFYPSNPPKKYSRKDGTGTSGRCSTFGSCDSGVLQGSDSYFIAGYDEYDTEGVLHKNSIVQSRQDFDVCPAVSIISEGPGLPSNLIDENPQNASIWEFTTTPTIYAKVADHCDLTTTGGYSTPYGENILTLSEEDTEEYAIARSGYSTDDGGIAFRSLRGPGEFEFTAAKVDAAAIMVGLVPGALYTIYYMIVTNSNATGQPVYTQSVHPFTAEASYQYVYLGEIPCAPGYSATISAFNLHAEGSETSSGNSITVPAGQFESTISQEDADAKAIAYAEANLDCSTQDPPLL